MMTRTPAEILQRFEQAGDLFGTERGDLIRHLPYAEAKPYLNEGFTEAEWEGGVDEGGNDPLEEALGYLPFAWKKASNCRGLSALRSIYHFKAWLWLAGVDVDAIGLDNYEYYGKPQLVTISVALDFDWRPHDRGGWVNDEEGADQRTDELVAECVAKGEELKAMLAA